MSTAFSSHQSPVTSQEMFYPPGAALTSALPDPVTGWCFLDSSGELGAL